jgi:hypothetical protein
MAAAAMGEHCSGADERRRRASSCAQTVKAWPCSLSPRRTRTQWPAEITRNVAEGAEERRRVRDEKANPETARSGNRFVFRRPRDDQMTRLQIASHVTSPLFHQRAAASASAARLA